MPNANEAPTLMLITLKLIKFRANVFSHPYHYKSIVGALQFITLARPDIAFIVNKACQFMSYLLTTHQLDVKQILRYLSGKMNFDLILLSFNSLHKFSRCAYSNNDCASDMDDRRSISGSCIFFGYNLVSWCSKNSHLLLGQVQRKNTIHWHILYISFCLSPFLLNFAFFSFLTSCYVTT